MTVYFPYSSLFGPKTAALGKDIRIMNTGFFHNAVTTFGRGAMITFAIFALGSTTASAQSLKEARAQRAEEQTLEREAAFTDTVCGTSLKASIDWTSVANWPDTSSLAQSCDGALGALEAICRSADGKRKAKRLTKFVCAGDGSGPSISGATLKYGAEPGKNGFAETKALLEKSL